MFSYSTYLKRNAAAGTRLFWVMNALGLTPYNHLVPKKLKYLPIIYSILLILWYSFQIVECILVFYDVPNLTVLRVVLAAQKLCQCLIPIIVISDTLFVDKGRILKEMFDSAIYTDQCFAMIGVEVDMTDMTHFINKYFIYVTVYSLSLLCLVVYCLMTLTRLSFFSSLTFTFFNLNHLIYSNYLTYYFCILIGLFKYRFKYVNDEMKTMIKSDCEGDKHTVILVKPFGFSEVTKIKTFKIIHAIYRDMVGGHNKRISIIMILQILQSMITVILAGYFLMCMLLKLIDYEGIGPYLYGIFIANVVQCFGMVICTAIICCSRTSSEANHTEYLVHKVMGETEDKESVNQLEQFSLELLHGKVEFKSYDYFTLDYTLITKIVGAVISYVIIILQFGKCDFDELIVFIKNGTLPEYV